MTLFAIVAVAWIVVAVAVVAAWHATICHYGRKQ